MIVDIVDKYCTDDNNPIKNLRLKNDRTLTRYCKGAFMLGTPLWWAINKQPARKVFLCIRVNGMEVTTHFVDLLYSTHFIIWRRLSA
jgi:hypothetical protein